MICSLLLLAGCSGKSEEIKTTYGRQGGSAATSVNGTSVLARMFTAAGHRVVRRTNSSAGIDSVQVIVWAPDSFEPPTPAERDLIEEWLTEESGRTFIYIGRDYDAAVEYWQQAAEDAAEDQAEELKRREAVALAQHNTRRVDIPADEDLDWFIARRDHPRQRVQELGGLWSEGVDAEKASIVLQAHYDVPDEQSSTTSEEDETEAETDDEEEVDEYDWEDEFSQRSTWSAPELSHEVLLSALPPGESDDDPLAAAGPPLVTRVTHPYWEDSALIVVTNGSFLLNMPLVNREHRKLAGQLIDECGYQPVKVAFWDSDSFIPFEGIDEEDQWAVLTTWPLNFILLHLAILGIIYILWKFPIFGPAKELPQVAPSDFGKHIHALGNLMAATGDVAYARQRLETYASTVRGETRTAEEKASAEK